jgi:hypothetical protein
MLVLNNLKSLGMLVLNNLKAEELLYSTTSKLRNTYTQQPES